VAKRWFIDVSSMVPFGQLAEFLLIARLDDVAQTGEYMEATMRPMGAWGDFPIPTAHGDNPLCAVGQDSVEPLLQAIMDYAWKRGMRPTKFDPHLADIGVRENDKAW
jgi:hypothetical protein